MKRISYQIYGIVNSPLGLTYNQYCRLHKYGILVLENYISPAKCKQLIDEIEGMIQLEVLINYAPEDVRIFHSERLSPDIERFFSDICLQKIASSYIGLSMVNRGCLANIVHPSSLDIGSGGSWHRDSNFPQFKTLVYLSDVPDESFGAFQYIPNTHRFSYKFLEALWGTRQIENTRWTNDEVHTQYPSSQTCSVTGEAGTLVLFDTSLLHHGAPNSGPQRQPRYALTNYYYLKHLKIGVDY